MDFFKEVKDFFSERLRSPIITSISFVFFLLNWPSLFNLVFGDTTVLERIEYFDANTTICSKYVFPVVFGFMLASIWPWIALAGSKVVSRGVARTKEFQIEEAHKVQLKRTKLRGEIQAEQDRIARDRENTIEEIARQRKQTAEEVGEDSLQRIKDALEQIGSVEKDEWDDWSDAEIAAMLFVEPHGAGFLISSEFEITSEIFDILGHNNVVRGRVEIRDALKQLEKRGNVEITYSPMGGSSVKPTSNGYKVIDRLKSLRG